MKAVLAVGFGVGDGAINAPRCLQAFGPDRMELAMNMKIITTLFLAICLPPTASAQVTNIETEGNLVPTQNPGCITVADAENTLTPPDLALGIRDCVSGEDYGRAFELIVLMQLRAGYDMKRVADRTSHQASTVLGMQVFGSLSDAQKAEISAAGKAFGETGSAAHIAFCARMRETGPPEYVPTYMIQHGMGAIVGQDGDALVEDFDPAQAWPELLVTYLKC